MGYMGDSGEREEQSPWWLILQVTGVILTVDISHVFEFDSNCCGVVADRLTLPLTNARVLPNSPPEEGIGIKALI
jgi:hypothetical protein